MRFSCGRPVCFRGTYLSNTRMHFADIWFCFSQFLKIYNTIAWMDVLKNICKMSLCMHESFRYCQNIYPNWLVFECGHNHNVCSSSRARYLRTTEGGNGNYGEGDTGHEQHEQMNCMSFMSRPLSFPRIWHSPWTPLPARIYLVTSNRVRTILALDIFATFWQELLAPLPGWNMSV